MESLIADFNQLSSAITNFLLLQGEIEQQTMCAPNFLTALKFPHFLSLY